MSIPLCRFCPKPAFFDFRAGVLLCADCAAEIFKLCEINSESCGGVEGHAESGQGARKGSNVKPFDSATLNSAAGIKPGPQDMISNLAGSLQREAPVVADTPSTAMAGASIEDGIPEMFRRQA